MQFNFLRGRWRRAVSRLGAISVLLVAVSVCAGASSISQRDIFVGASARAVGMGSAFTAGPSATNGFLWNPSSLGFMEGVEINMGGMPFTGNTARRDQAFSVAANPHTFGWTRRALGNISLATWLDGWNTETAESTQIVLLGYGLALGPNTSAGANLRYYQNNTTVRTNFLWSVDLGMQFAYPLERWGDSVKIGVNLSELSSGIRENDVLLENAPLAARFGTSYELGGNTLFSADIVVRGENRSGWGERLRLHLGAERWFVDGHLGVRFGYTALTASDRFSAGELARGLSFRNDSGQLDYAYVSGAELEQGVHWVSATLRWGGGEPRTQPSGDEPGAERVAARTEPPPPILMPKTLATDVEALNGKVTVSEPAISPNGDGILDSTTFRFTLGTPEPASVPWQLILRDVYTENVWETSGTGVPAEGVRWDGIAATGNLVPDGDYTVELHVLDTHDTPHFIDTAKVTVDMIPTTVEFFAKTATSIGVKTWDLNPLTGWKLEVFDANRALVEQASGEGTPPPEVVLNAVQTRPQADYVGKLHVHDIAGNPSVAETTLQLGVAGQVEAEPAAASQTLTLMVGSFVERSYAEAMETRLRQQHPDQKIGLHVATLEGKTMHRVTIGEFTSRAESVELKEQIQETLGVEPVLILF